jgi:serine/threonine protein kinase
MVLSIITDEFEQFYEIQDDLGSGQFAVVKRVRELSTGHEFAAKFVRKKKCVAGKRGLKREEILREADILSELAPHANIITLHNVFENKHEIILVLELVGAGELFHYIAEKDALNEEEAAKFILQILEGVHHMHEKNIVHLDLKPENVMLLEKNKTQIKIIDFGISRKLRPNEPTKETFGTPEFVAPEVIAFEPVTLATDMWSIGVITYILLSGASPFLGNTNQETFTNIAQVDYRFDEEFFANTSDLAKDFIQQLFVKNPRQRATVVDCLNHPWIKPRRRKDEEERRNAQINMPSFKSFIARRRWKVQMHCESRILRTVTTKKIDRAGNVQSAKHSERKGKTAIYEGQYSETDDSENESEHSQKDEDFNPSKRIHCCPQNIEMRQIKSSEFAESFQGNEEGDDDDDESVKRNHHRADTSTSLMKNPLPNEQIVSDQHSRSQTSDTKVIESVDEVTGQNVRTTVQNKVHTDENLKISKSDNIQYEETEEGTLKKVTTKTRKMKKIVKTTTSSKQKGI